MTSQQRKIIAFIVLLVELLALFLAIFGIYVRFAGTGNPMGSIYILVGFVVAVGGAIPILIISWKRKDKPKL